MAADTAVQARRLCELFEQRFGGSRPRLVRAPGRVNLIGEHTDYNEGFVMPAAIDFYTSIACAARADGRIVAESLQFRERLDAAVAERRERQGDWTDYCWGVLQSLRQAGANVCGATLLVDSNVLVSAGLSSSAALEVATGFALLTLAGIEPDLVQLAKTCQRAENEFVGARCGIMDQFISCVGRAGHALVLDCRSLAYRYAPIPAGLAIVICNSMVKHSIAGGEYNERRAQCEEGVRRLRQHLPRIASLRDVTAEQLEAHKDALPEVTYRRCRHVVDENARVMALEQALAAGNLASAGWLMAASHASLRDDYEVSCRELDVLVELASAQPGVVGARMTGGGFGGCTVNLVRDAEVESFRRAVADGYRQKTQIVPEIYCAVASRGVHEASRGSDLH